VETQYFLSIRYNMPFTMKSRSLAKRRTRRMRSLRRHCNSKIHRRALRSRSLRTRKMHRKLCRGVRRKTARKVKRKIKRKIKRKTARKVRRKVKRKSMRRKTARRVKRKIKRKRRYRGGTTNYSNNRFPLSPANVTEQALNA
jgi:hypothetical protein